MFNGSATMIPYNFGKGPVFFTDASNSGYGIVLGEDWQAGKFVDCVSVVGLPPSLRPHGHWCDIV